MKVIRSFMLSVLCIFTVISTTGCSSGGSGGSSSLTKEKYDNINDGVEYSKVCSIIGSDGTLLTQNGQKGKDETAMYFWTTENGTKVYFTFQNSKLVSKSQY